MDYIAVIDYEHLDNGVFLTSFALALATQKASRGLILHADSAYTERLIQSGFMRADASLRAARDLNHRLIALLADHGISAIGLNGHQRSLVTLGENRISVDRKQIEKLPPTPHLLLSSIALRPEDRSAVRVSLAGLAAAAQHDLEIAELLLFTLDDRSEMIDPELPDTIRKSDLERFLSPASIPEEFRDIPVPFRLVNSRQFGRLPDFSGITRIVP